MLIAEGGIHLQFKVQAAPQNILNHRPKAPVFGNQHRNVGSLKWKAAEEQE
jgi:hypothetical protein